MPRLTILADENVPFAREAFGTLGDVRLEHGRRILPAGLADVDLLVVRSITRVDAALLAATPVRFVGTATSGTDHVAEPDLERLGIAFYAARGCNAAAVAEYMAAAWLTLAARRGETLAGRRVGVVGVGHVGSLVVQKARALGMEPVLNDPPKARHSGSAIYRPLDDLLDCDIVTCHTPLTFDGPDPTVRLIGEAFLARLKPGAWLCNAGRGGVVDEAALHRALDAGRLGAVVLDVWDHEPAIDSRLLRRVDIGTPHIAGYSLEGKLNGTGMVYDAACRFLGVEPAWRLADAMPPRPAGLPIGGFAPESGAGFRSLDRAGIAALAARVAEAYPILRDDEALKATALMDDEGRGRAFDLLRKMYPVRREFS
ncbi:MAG TPA: 4-phosphoerythronate dehydrogenase [Vicinamibacterales bacterium]|nr:4-phosphoerythronate dehydrogenase [Vicinamibacterales bacterium]HPK71308.1 4-phosphoerythronate dehydrogenase [Vicinamibacterales bacterium]